MKSLEQLRQFCDSDLKIDLQAFERQRKKLMVQLLIVFGILVGVMGLAMLFQLGQKLPPKVFSVIILFCILIGTVYYYFASRKYRNGFKTVILSKLITYIQPDLEYLPEQGISKELFMAAGVFQHRIDSYECEDMIQGKIDKTQMMFSEVHAEYKTGSGKHKSWHTIFKGIFFIADFNKNFQYKTVVLPDTAEKLFGIFGQTLQSWNSSYGELVRMEDVEFEKEFVVYGTNQIEARYILSPALMERILQFKRNLGTKLYLSFLGSKVFGAIPVEKNLFEPKVFGSMLDFNVIAEYYTQLQFGASVVEELNLNTRIWTKK